MKEIFDVSQTKVFPATAFFIQARPKFFQPQHFFVTKTDDDKRSTAVTYLAYRQTLSLNFNQPIYFYPTLLFIGVK